MAHSLSFLLSSEAASARMIERKPAYVVHMEVAPNTDAPMIELDATSRMNAKLIARSWLIHGRAHAVTAGIRKVHTDGTLGEADILEVEDFEDDLAEETQNNLNRVMSNYGLVG